MKLLDLFCGAGGAAMGYHRAGFEVTGVDIKPQPHYPFKFVQADALEYCREHGREYDAIHASPPCQAYSMMQNVWKNKEKHPDLIEPTREILIRQQKPYVIENVYKAPLKTSFMLCGTMFQLKIIKHRYFECNPEFFLLTACDHRDVYDPWHTRNGKQRFIKKYKESLGINWMNSKEMYLAIPPVYTEFIGKELMRYLKQ